jgi:hypothetical protein
MSYIAAIDGALEVRAPTHRERERERERECGTCASAADPRRVW